MILGTLIAVGLLGVTLAQPGGPQVTDIASRLELFTDRALIESLSGGAALRMHRPTPQEIALVADAPWEGNASIYVTVFRDGDVYRMYYRGGQSKLTPQEYAEAHPSTYCYAESTDGIHWTKPDLGLVEFAGSRHNNIVLLGIGADSFAPFIDTNPACPPDAKYKAIANGGGGGAGLYVFRSPDGLHWSRVADKPVITKGAFDSQNLAFWDITRHEYRCYFRDFREGRDIKTSTSPDMATWSEPTWLDYAPGRSGELYTNQILPYYRAPHIFLGFPTRYVDRGWTPSHEYLPQLDHRHVRAGPSPREGSAVTEGMFMSSHDGQHFSIWPEAFLRPGLRTRDEWFYGDNYQAWGLVETKSAIADTPPEISLYATEGYHQEQGGTAFRRYTLRVDGFVSVEAPLSGGEMLTKPLTFSGRELVLNVSTSAAGSVRVEIQGVDGKPLPGYALADCPEIFGDSLGRPVAWKAGGYLSKLAGQPIRLRFELKDADLYSMRFR